MACLEEVRTDSVSFNRETFGNIFHHKRSIINRLNDIQKAMETVELKLS